MSERTVHWIGTGLSNGSGLRLLADRPERLLVWGRTTARADTLLTRLGLTGRAGTRALSTDTLADAVQPGDVVVSMLPATEHLDLLRLCVARKAHFACSSYQSEAMAAEAVRAKPLGLVVLTEVGLDPGIDHLFADLLVAKARDVVGASPAVADLTSYCGGVPETPNDFRYRFSWAPRGVLNALRSPARYREESATKVVEFPWEATRPEFVDGAVFEAYPNRDSLPYLSRYGFPETWEPRTFIRGTLRLDGWHDAWTDVFATVRTGDADRIGELADELAARYPTTDADRDRVILIVTLTVHSGTTRWSGRYLMDIVGTATESAMALTVSTPLANGVTEILDGTLAPGLHQGAPDPQRWLDFLAAHGIPWEFTENGGAS